MAALVATATAHADPAPADDHFEATMGFLTTAQDHRETGFANDAAPALPGAFAAAPYDRALGLGLRYDARAVISHVRMTVGLDLPFSAFDRSTMSRVDEHAVTPRSMWSWALRFGLGAECRFGAWVPFVDLQGSTQRVSTTVEVDGRATEYEAWRFGFSGRAGLRVHLRKWFFVTAAGELGLLGPTRWSADVGVGFRIGS